MIEIKRIRENPDEIREATIAKGFDGAVVDELLRADEKRVDLIKEVETLRQEKNKLGRDDVQKGRELREQIKDREGVLNEAKNNFIDLMLKIPNPSAPDVRIGTEADNEVLKEVGEPRRFGFNVRDHVDLGELTNTIDIKRGSKVAQSGFYYVKNEGALLEFALTQFAMDSLMEKGFIPVITPNLVKEEALVGCGFQARSDKERQIYSVEDEDLDLIATAEISLVGQHSDEIFKPEDLPKKYVGFSYCYRRERGSYGSDVRGILRVHEFRKVEMVLFCIPDESDKWHERLLEAEEELWQDLEVPYRVVKMASGDLGNAASRKYDIETWMPSQGTYREVTSTSNTTDFQARRLNIKYKDGKKNRPLHTLNGTALALGRTMIALYENYQNEDGSISIPKVLQKRMGGRETITVK